MGHDDAALIHGWRRGDPAAFAGLVRRWEKPIGRFLHHMVGRADAVQDLCQEVFLRVYTARNKNVEPAAFSTWLYRIALNVVRDSARRRRHQLEPIGNHEPMAPESNDAEAQELAAAVRETLAELPEDQRLAVVLRHYEGMNFEQIARLTQTPASTIKSRFTTAVHRLRERLESSGWGHD